MEDYLVKLPHKPSFGQARDWPLADTQFAIFSLFISEVFWRFLRDSNPCSSA